jgi:rare lipoprotein A
VNKVSITALFIATTARLSLSRPWLAATALSALLAAPAFALNPIFSSRVWDDNNLEAASVCLNGKEIVVFHAPSGSGKAAQDADDLAAKLQTLVASKNFDPNQLVPAQDGDKAAIKLPGNLAVSLMPLSSKIASNASAGKLADKSSDKGDLNSGSGIATSLKLVNSIRVSMGCPALPGGFPDFKAIAGKGSAAFSGQASWYGPHFHGHRTSNGHRFDMEELTAAHRSLPFGTKLLVVNHRTGDTCIVEVNDRGPFVNNRVLDLSRGAARRLNMIGSGVAKVDCLVLGVTGSN